MSRTPREHHGWIRQLWSWAWRPSVSLPLLLLLMIGIAIGAAGIVTANTSLELTATNQFCLTCHSKDAGLEWQQSGHFSNRLGFTVDCSSCHIPHALVPELMRKMQASEEVLSWLEGTIDTPEKYEANRLRMAQKEWARLHANGSAECQSCHRMETMDDHDQPFVRDMHHGALATGQTCIDCHKGVAHKAPDETAAAAAQ